MDIRYTIFSLGDSAATIDLGSSIHPALNQKVLSMRQQLQDDPFKGLKDSIVAYSSLTLYYDPVLVKKTYQPRGAIFDWVKQRLQQAYELSGDSAPVNTPLIRIPVCYDETLGTDLQRLAAEKQLSIPEIINLHIGRTYRVYMIGFLPGFSYMGQVDEKLVVPRKARPEPVLPGSVGLTGSQTGIYPLQSPGGWYIIGRTPLRLFNSTRDPLALLQAGDEVQFYPVSRDEFDEIRAKS